jgi:nicotinic acid phosphoribosyltransferase
LLSETNSYLSGTYTDQYQLAMSQAYFLNGMHDEEAVFDLVVATQDWHPPADKSFFHQSPGKRTIGENHLEGHRTNALA